MTIRIARRHGAWAAALLLAACGGEAPDSEDDRVASGELLDGTIGDDMLPLDSLTSQPPRLDPVETGARGGDAADSTAPAQADPEAGQDIIDAPGSADGMEPAPTE